MKRSLVLAAAAITAIGAVGCTSRSMRSVFHRGAPCGAGVATPVVGDMTTTYSPGCGMADCPTCGTTSGTPLMFGDSYGGGFFGDQTPLPAPVEP